MFLGVHSLKDHSFLENLIFFLDINGILERIYSCLTPAKLKIISFSTPPLSDCHWLNWTCKFFSQRANMRQKVLCFDIKSETS